MKNILFALLLLSSLILICCDNSNPVNSPVSNQYSIWYMDSLGNSIGGDSNNFCFDNQFGCFEIKPVYPNPVNKYFNINIKSNGCPDTLSLYFLKGEDTTWIFKDKFYSAGSHLFILNKDSLGFHNEIVKLNLLVKHSSIYGTCPIPIGKCFNSGNIRFN